MIDRILGVSFVGGAALLALFLFQQNYAVPPCRADVVTRQVTNQVSPAIGTGGLQFLNIRSVTGGIFSRSRECEMEVAPIVGFQTRDEAHWTKVLYSESRDRSSNGVTVTARILGPAGPAFAGVPGDHAAAATSSARAD